MYLKLRPDLETRPESGEALSALLVKDPIVKRFYRFSPVLRLISPISSDAVRDSGADADLEEDALVGSLPPLVRRILSESRRGAS
ncbi:MAG: hypothetical protein DMG07_27535 [Acidobacteria bacterium]|nr:MAG: hypothetical protein DMG07_27535 [Acidobacteriota bacterium]